MRHRLSRKRLQAIVDYYEDNMGHMMRCSKYAEMGLLLMSCVKPGDVIYLISSQIHICCVEQIEFTGDNDSMITVRDITDRSSHCWGKRYIVRNKEYGSVLFTDQEEAEKALREQKGGYHVKEG